MWGKNIVYPKKYAHGFCFAVLCYTLTDFPISIRLTSLALWRSNDCPSASKATLMNMDKYFMWIHYEQLHNHNKAKHNKTVCIFLGIHCTYQFPVSNACQYTELHAKMRYTSEGRGQVTAFHRYCVDIITNPCSIHLLFAQVLVRYPGPLLLTWSNLIPA